jgi:osomolarity two-component system, sensor histidine kinase SLN1
VSSSLFAQNLLTCEGGRVELSLSKHESDSSLLTRTIGDLPPPPQSPRAQVIDAALDGALEEANVKSEAELANSAKPLRMQRPSYVPLPEQRSFSLEENALPTSYSNAPSAYSVTDTMSGSNADQALHVLVVDDDAWTRILMTRMLTRLGCKVSTAENGEVALEMIMGHVGRTPSSESGTSGALLDQVDASTAGTAKYNIIFLDNQMPVLSGLKLVARLRELGRRDFIVGVTGNALLSDQEEYLAAGADRFVYERVPP